MCTRYAKRPGLAGVGIVGLFIQRTLVFSSKYGARNSAPRSRSQGAGLPEPGRRLRSAQCDALLLPQQPRIDSLRARVPVDYLHDGHNYHNTYRNDNKHLGPACFLAATAAALVLVLAWKLLKPQPSKADHPVGTPYDIKIDATAAGAPTPSHGPDAEASLRAYGRALLLAAAAYCLVIWFVSTTSLGAEVNLGACFGCVSFLVAGIGLLWEARKRVFSLLRIAIILSVQVPPPPSIISPTRSSTNKLLAVPKRRVGWYTRVTFEHALASVAWINSGPVAMVVYKENF
ncbi:hypothetical protein DL767_010431 [Monosporascus sp. MG133]|nr:hypothetical protein DL767_010431 [Monosporascus sp. MG133]